VAMLVLIGVVRGVAGYADVTRGNQYCAGPIWEGSSSGEADCASKCDDDTSCNYYSFWHTGGANYCRTSASCDQTSQQGSDITIKKKVSSSAVTAAPTPVPPPKVLQASISELVATLTSDYSFEHLYDVFFSWKSDMRQKGQFTDANVGAEGLCVVDMHIDVECTREKCLPGHVCAHATPQHWGHKAYKYGCTVESQDWPDYGPFVDSGGIQYASYGEYMRGYEKCGQNQADSRTMQNICYSTLCKRKIPATRITATITLDLGWKNQNDEVQDTQIAFSVICGEQTKISICPLPKALHSSGALRVSEDAAISECVVKKSCGGPDVTSLRPENDANGNAVWGGGAATSTSTGQPGSWLESHSEWPAIQAMDAFKRQMQATCSRTCGFL